MTSTHSGHYFTKIVQSPLFFFCLSIWFFPSHIIFMNFKTNYWVGFMPSIRHVVITSADNNAPCK